MVKVWRQHFFEGIDETLHYLSRQIKASDLDEAIDQGLSYAASKCKGREP